jgi:methionyl-tRNA formyltransferase
VRIIYFGNNWLGWQLLQFVKAQGAEVVGLVLHPPARRKFGEQIIAATALPPDRVFDASRIGELEFVDSLTGLKPDLGLSVSFGYILRRELLSLFHRGCINLHTSLLPWNRGANPNVWSIIDGTPAGVTLHYIDDGVDTGDIIAQEEVSVAPTDTGQTLFAKLEHAAVKLFVRTWPAFLARGIKPTPQDITVGSTHRVSDLARLDEINLSERYTAGDLINILRARTFNPYSGAYFLHNGRKIFMQLTLKEEEERHLEAGG